MNAMQLLLHFNVQTIIKHMNTFLFILAMAKTRQYYIHHFLVSIVS